MLDAEAVNSIAVSDDQKRTILLGEIAEAGHKSPFWRLILDWGEARCNVRLAAMRKAINAASDVKLGLQNRWNADEQFLQDLQVFVEGLIADRDALLETFSRATHDIRVRSGEAGFTEPASFPDQGIEGEPKTNGRPN